MKKILLAGFLLLPVYGFAASCVSVDVATSALVVNTTPVGECTAFVILSAEEWGGVSVWAIPTVDDVVKLWASAFVLPLSLFLFSWAIGRLIRLFRS